MAAASATATATTATATMGTTIQLQRPRQPEDSDKFVGDGALTMAMATSIVGPGSSIITRWLLLPGQSDALLPCCLTSYF